MSHPSVEPLWWKALVLVLMGSSPALAQGPPKPPGPPDGSRRNWGRGLPATAFQEDLYAGTSQVDLDYDAMGNLLSRAVSVDDDEDGVIDSSSAWVHSYDPAGNQVQSQWLLDGDGDGAFDSTTVTIRVFGPSRSLLAEVSTSDGDNDGAPDSQWGTNYQYDSRGLLEREDYWSDYDLDGIPDLTGSRLVTNDRAGRELTSVTSWSTGNTLTVVNTYDRRGRLAAIWRQSVSGWTSYESDSSLDYDALGRLVLDVTTTTGGPFAPGTILDDYVYDRSGRLLQQVSSLDWTSDGSVDQVGTMDWQYNQKGNLLQVDQVILRGRIIVTQSTVYYSY